LNITTLRVWTWRLALFVAFIVALLSYLGGVSFLWIVFRSILAYGLIYGLSEIGVYLFEKTGINEDFNSDVNLGALLDIAVGEEGEQPSLDFDSGEEVILGQPNALNGYSSGGVEQTPIPGQVTQDLAQGLPNEQQQAEIVRRMGWGE
jgi:hypothetical protein